MDCRMKAVVKIVKDSPDNQIKASELYKRLNNNKRLMKSGVSAESLVCTAEMLGFIHNVDRDTVCLGKNC